MNRAAPLREFYKCLKQDSGPRIFNPWTQTNADDQPEYNGPAQRLRRLQQHLTGNPTQLLLGEASGYQGCRVSGIPFTSERLLLAGTIPRVSGAQARLTTRERPWSEPSATTVWGALTQFGIASSTVLWNAFAWHPHKPGQPQSNRTPERAERERGLEVLQLLLAAFPDVRLFAVGRHAQQQLQLLGRSAVPLRHPSMGGALIFRRELGQALHEPSPRSPPRVTVRRRLKSPG